MVFGSDQPPIERYIMILGADIGYTLFAGITSVIIRIGLEKALK